MRCASSCRDWHTNYLAFCPCAVEVGPQVVVINNRGGRQVDVEPWPMTDVGLGAASRVD